MNTNNHILLYTDTFTRQRLEAEEAESVVAALADEDQFCTVCNARFNRKPNFKMDVYYCPGCGASYIVQWTGDEYVWAI